MEKVKVTPLSGESFTILLNAKQFGQDDVLEVAPAGVKMRVKKVYPLTWWKKILMWFGWKYHSMDLEIITDEVAEKFQKQREEHLNNCKKEACKNKFIPDGI